MRGWLKYGLITLAAIVGVFVVFGLVVYANGGGFKTIEHQFAGTCNPVTGPGSTEDILIDRDSGIAFLSTQLRPTPEEGVRGYIALYDVASGAGSFQGDAMPGLDDFKPHGISLYKDANGNKRLFVINHRSNDEDTVELFDLGPEGSFSHVETIRDPLISSANNLVAVGSRQFYVANDFSALKGLRQFMDMSFGVGFLNLVYYNGETIRVVIDGVSSAGGIAVSADYSQLYVAFTTDQAVVIYDRDQASGDITYRTSVDVGMGVDNLDVAADGSIWVAGHPKSLALAQHFMSGGKEPSPSQVSRIPMTDGDPGAQEDIYFDTGEQLSASAVAATYGGKMLVGSITAKNFLLCDLP